LNNRIRSSWEIALEKAEKLGRLSPEEAQKKLEEEFYPRGKALAEKYLKGLPRRDLEIELGKFTDEKQKAIVKRGFLATLAGEISLEEAEKSARALEGISLVGGGSASARTAETIAALIHTYQEAKDNLYKSCQQTVSAGVTEQLKQEGISGSAIQVNVLAAKEWQDARKQLFSSYDVDLASLKKNLPVG